MLSDEEMMKKVTTSDSNMLTGNKKKLRQAIRDEIGFIGSAHTNRIPVL